MNRLVLTLFVFSFLFASATETRTNSHLGSLRGRVTDASSQILPGATIIVEELNTGVTTDVNGFCSLELPAGTYTLNVSYVGFESKKVNITVDNAKTQEENISLSEGVELKEVEIVGALAGQRRALQMQKSSIGVVNVVSAEQTGKFPDTNIGDALKRISGINVQYDQGEARFGQVRGTSSDLMSVSVNGNRLPPAEGDTRNVQLDLIPTDMIQTIEVNKVVTSDMDGDAIGGAVNLVTKSSPSRRVANFTIGTGNYPVSGKPQLNLGATFGNRFFGKKLGVIASASYQYMPGGSDNTEFEYVEQDGELQLREAQVRQYYVTRERQSYSLSLDYKFNPDHKIAFKALYNLRNDWENRYRISYKKLNESANKQSVEIQTKGGSSSNDNARLERQQTMDFSFDGTHHFGKLSADWNLSYSRATEERPEERYVAYSSKGTDYGSAFADVFLRQPYCTLPIPSVTDSSWSIDELTNSNQDIEENEYKTRVNFSLPLATGLYGNKLSFGAKYVLKDKSRVTDFYEYEDYILGDWRSSVTSEIRNGFMPGSRYPIGTQFISKHLLTNFELIYSHPDLMLPWFPLLGNHEYRGNTQAVIDYSDVSRRWMMPARYYTKVVEDNGVSIRLVLIDTTPLIDKYQNDSITYPDAHKQDAGEQLRWIDKTLAGAAEDWVVVIGHHPVYAQTSKSESERTDLQQRLLPLLRRYGNVDMYVSGHIHNFQHIKPKGDSIDYVVNTSASLARKVSPVEGTVFCSGSEGFSVLTADKTSLRLHMIDKDGAVIHTVTRQK